MIGNSKNKPLATTDVFTKLMYEASVNWFNTTSLTLKVAKKLTDIGTTT